MDAFYTHLISGFSKNSNVLIVASMDEAIEIAKEIERKGHIDIFLFGNTNFLEQYADKFDDVYVIDQVDPHPGKVGSGYSSGLPLIWGRNAWKIWESFGRHETSLLGNTNIRIRGTHFRKVGLGDEEFGGRGLMLTASR